MNRCTVVHCTVDIHCIGKEKAREREGERDRGMEKESLSLSPVLVSCDILTIDQAVELPEYCHDRCWRDSYGAEQINAFSKVRDDFNFCY